MDDSHASKKARKAVQGTRTRYLMIGGGPHSWIGFAHRRACALDGVIELVGGVFSSDWETNQAHAKSLCLNPARVYKDYMALLEAEDAVPETERAHFVLICTPNKWHYMQAKACLAHKFHIVVDKPLCSTVEEAKEIHSLAQGAGLLVGLTHTYSGYDMIKHARHLVRQGKLGTIRKVVMQYPQGWLTREKSSMSSSVGISSLVDVGTHAFHLVEHICGLTPVALVATAATHVGGQREPDDYSILLRFDGGATGVIIAGQSYTGEVNDIRISVHGTACSAEWHQEVPARLHLLYRDRPAETLQAGSSYLCPEALRNNRLPSGHPEGYLEAMANIYRSFARAVLDVRTQPDEVHDFPSSMDGVRGLLFVRAVEHSITNTAWVHLDDQMEIKS